MYYHDFDDFIMVITNCLGIPLNPVVYQYKNAVAVPWYSDCITVVQNQMVLWYFELKFMSREEISWCLCSHPKTACIFIMTTKVFTLKIPQQYIFVSVTQYHYIKVLYATRGIKRHKIY